MTSRDARNAVPAPTKRMLMAKLMTASAVKQAQEPVGTDQQLTVDGHRQHQGSPQGALLQELAELVWYRDQGVLARVTNHIEAQQTPDHRDAPQVPACLSRHSGLGRDGHRAQGPAALNARPRRSVSRSAPRSPTRTAALSTPTAGSRGRRARVTLAPSEPPATAVWAGRSGATRKQRSTLARLIHGPGLVLRTVSTGGRRYWYGQYGRLCPICWNAPPTPVA